MNTNTQFKKGMAPWNKGVFGAKHSESTKKKMSESRMGHILSEETRKKISLAHIGIKFSAEHRRKLSIAKLGERSPKWKGGICAMPEYAAFHSRQRRLRKLNARGTHAPQEWVAMKKKYNFTCLDCFKKEPEIKLEEDHIIPLSKKGTDFIENIQPLCRVCNAKKGSKIMEKVTV